MMRQKEKDIGSRGHSPSIQPKDARTTKRFAFVLGHEQNGSNQLSYTTNTRDHGAAATRVITHTAEF